MLAPPTERPLAQSLWRCLLREAPRRFYLVVGPRRVGKTTCLFQTVRHLLAHGISPTKIWWLRLDHPLLVGLDLGTLVREVIRWSGATAESPVHVFLDELTYAANWDLWLKTFYDEAWPVRIAASSSATAELRQGRHESGIGRWDELYLPPYSFLEYLALIEVPAVITPEVTLSQTLAAITTDVPTMPAVAAELRRFLLTGGFPELLLAESRTLNGEEDAFLRSQERLRSDAVSCAIFQDIPQTFTIDNPRLLERLLFTLGGQLTGMLSPKKIAGGLEMSAPTVEKYLSYLEQACLVFTTQGYARAEGNVQKRGRKLYFVDGAVRNAALQRGSLPLNNPEEEGLLLENVVASHLHALALLRQTRLYYWHQDSAAEVDVVFDEASGPIAFEVGRGSDHHRRGLRAFMARYPASRGRSYIVSPEAGILAASRSEDGIGRIPLALLLLAVGAQSQAALHTRLGI